MTSTETPAEETENETLARDPETFAVSQIVLRESLRREWANWIRHKRSFCILTFEVDGFAKLVSNKGEKASRVVLQQIVKIFQQTVRKEDLVGRGDGDQLVVLARESDLLGGFVLADRLRALVAIGKPEPVTVSGGVACSTEPAITQVEALRDLSRARLLEAKLKPNSIQPPKPRSPKDGRNKSIGLAVVVALVAVAVGISTRKTLPKPIIPAVPSATMAANAPPPASPAPSLSASPLDRTKTVAGLREMLDHYREASRYDPRTVRLTSEMVDLLVPNQNIPIEIPNNASGKPGGRRTVGVLLAERVNVVEGEKLGFKFEVRALPDRVLVSDITIESTVVNVINARGKRVPSTAKLSLTPTKIAGQFAGVLPISSPELKADSYVMVDVVWSEKSMPTKGTASAQLYFGGAASGRFVGECRDAMKDGSLSIGVEVEIDDPGTFEVVGNLFDATGKPVATGKFDGELKKGRQVVDLLFFGLAIRDASANGPYTLTTLRGHRVAGLYGALLSPTTTKCTTKPYKSSEFAAAEYDSPAKRAAISAYEGEIVKLEKSN